MKGGFACAFALLGCGANPDRASDCVAVSKAPIYFGSESPAHVELDPRERAAIGLVLPTQVDAACTGVLQPGGWVLTARHCDVGALTFQTSGDNARTSNVIDVEHHPDYDVMLLELDDAWKSLDATPLALWGDAIDATWVGTRVTLAGVGETETGAIGLLRFAEEPVVSVDDVEIHVDGMGLSGACVGDSGGPLLVAASDGSARVAGVLDRGSKNCVGLDIYTRADVIRDWAEGIVSTPRSSCTH